MLIDAERPLNLPVGDGPLVNYFIMAWQCWSSVKLRGVLLPAHHSHPDNLVNKGHRWASHCWMQDRSLNERHMDKRKGDRGGNSWEGQNVLQLPLIVAALAFDRMVNLVWHNDAKSVWSNVFSLAHLKIEGVCRRGTACCVWTFVAETKCRPQASALTVTDYDVLLSFYLRSSDTASSVRQVTVQWQLNILTRCSWHVSANHIGRALRPKKTYYAFQCVQGNSQHLLPFKPQRKVCLCL